MKRLDENIKKDVIDQLYWNKRVNIADIKIKVSGGEVTMMGSVPTYSARIAAAHDIEMIEGVTNIENKLVVTPRASMLPDDSQIQKRTMTALAWNADIHSMDIEIAVQDGVVTLKGTVDEYWKKWEASDVVSNVNGVTDVINNLAIVNTQSFWDKDIAKEVEQALKRNSHIDSQNITVKVDRGKVTLTGVVPSWFAHSEAEKCAAYSSGVLDVENLIIVEHHGTVRDHIDITN
jgi:osmotically-inducible protein OsmY